MAWPLILLVRVYQIVVSPLLPPACRFYPSCSRYAVQALREHSVTRGLGLIAWRLLRCHPFHPGGYDPVPPRVPASPPMQAGAARTRRGAGQTVSPAR